ncbi:hypothetical protein GCM10027612_46750 [Microbispora bryophytorum subsp. camponoti]
MTSRLRPVWIPALVALLAVALGAVSITGRGVARAADAPTRIRAFRSRRG